MEKENKKNVDNQITKDVIKQNKNKKIKKKIVVKFINGCRACD